jgi:glutamine amidotransferase-like uncharacterized protein
MKKENLKTEMQKFYSLLIIILLFSCAKEKSVELTPLVPINNDPPETIIIGIYSDEGANPYCARIATRMFKWMDYDIREIMATDINSNNLGHINLIYFPGGSTLPYRTKITDAGRTNLRNHIWNGCAYIGTCAGALIACEKNIWKGSDHNEGLFGIFPGIGIGPIPELPRYPDVCMTEIELDNTHQIAVQEGGSMWLLYINSPYFESETSNVFQTIGNYTTNNKPALVLSTFGQGKIFLTGPHPEFEEDSDLDKNNYYDNLSDRGSDWEMMKAAVKWCLE